MDRKIGKDISGFQGEDLGRTKVGNEGGKRDNYCFG